MYDCLAAEFLAHDPWVCRDTPKRHSFLWVLDKKPTDEILSILGHSPREAEIHPRNAAIRCRVTFSFKRRTAHQKFVEQDPQAPYIYLFVMLATFYHFWWQIVECPTEGVSS